MPPEYNNPSLARKASRKKRNREAEDDHVRRERGELACSECNRMKLKCDKKVPCSSCIRRCCSDICPNGYKRTATRILPVMSERLQDKIRELTQRVRQLEDALAILQATVSQEPHPLLSAQHEVQPLQLVETAHEVEGTEKNLGSLTIQDKKEVFFGPTAGDETLFLHGPSASVFGQNNPTNGLEEQELLEQPAIPGEIVLLSEVFPFLPGGKWNDKSSLYAILDLLPDQNRAWSLLETYFHQGSYGFRMVLRDEAIGELLTPLYNHMKTVNLASPTPVPLTPHQISSLFSIFSLGAYVDFTRLDQHREAELYHKLALCAFALHNLYEPPEFATVQAACLLSAYFSIGSCDDRQKADAAWRYLSFACDIAHNIGLHRDPGRWGFNQKVADKRRNAFWELYTADTHFSLAAGRPPHFHRDYIDCGLPSAHQDSPHEGRVVLGTFWDWRHKFALEVHSYIVELTLKTKAPNYDTILTIDAKLREFPLLPYRGSDSKTEDESHTQTSPVSHVLLKYFKARATMYLHRSHFVKAMVENSSDPLKSKYAPSFLTTFRSACEIINIEKKIYGWISDQISRWWHFYVQLFSAAIVVGSVLIRSPSPSMIKLAFENLNTAVELSSMMSKGKGRYARYAQAIVKRIHIKATAVYNQILANPSDSESGGLQDSFDDAELQIFGGHTIVSQIENSKLSPPRSPLAFAPNEDLGTSSISSQVPLVTSDDPQINGDWNIPYDCNYMDESHSIFANTIASTSENVTNPNSTSSQHRPGVNLGNNFYDFNFAEVPWAELIAPVDPNFTTAHANESRMIDDYWTSLMDDAGVLNSFPTV